MGEIVLGSRLHLVGILAGGVLRPSELRLSSDDASYVTLDQELNLGHTFGARALRETLDALAKRSRVSRRLQGLRPNFRRAPVPSALGLLCSLL